MEQEMHPLEGKYIAYNFGEQDHEDERWALALFKLRDSKMGEVYKPSSYYPFGEINEVESNNRLRMIIRRKKITEIYSVFHNEAFFGIPGGWVSLDDQDDDREEGEDGDREERRVETWFEYKPIFRDSYESHLLKQIGVEVRFYTES